jgi:hypothetical protein
MNWLETGRFLVTAGVILGLVGFLLMAGDKIPIGRLPLDFSFGSDKFKIYVPLATCVILSVIITLVVNFFSRR